MGRPQLTLKDCAGVLTLVPSSSPALVSAVCREAVAAGQCATVKTARERLRWLESDGKVALRARVKGEFPGQGGRSLVVERRSNGAAAVPDGDDFDYRAELRALIADEKTPARERLSAIKQLREPDHPGSVPAAAAPEWKGPPPKVEIAIASYDQIAGEIDAPEMRPAARLIAAMELLRRNGFTVVEPAGGIPDTLE